jgi:dTDP-4-amino-4,6-dideoxygalactose transaminase
MEVLESDHQQGDGPFTVRASQMVSNLVGGGHVLLTPSCTHALEMASMLGNFAPGDEVILPSYTFTSAATAVTKFGATPVFVDIDPVTKGIDANQVADAVTDKTVAISWVNYAGIAPDIEALQDIAKKHDLLLIEDNAHGLGGTYKGKPLGSFGHFATQSFHATKNIQCGEGGALVINVPEFIERAEVIREKGTNRSRFVRGEVQKYQWVDQGSSYLLAEVLSAVLQGQLEAFEEIQKNRLMVWNEYNNLIEFNLENLQIKRMTLPKDSLNIAHLYYLEIENTEILNTFIQNMKLDNVSISRHYVPLGNSLHGKKMGRIVSSDIEAVKFSSQMIRVPIWSKMNRNTTETILSSINKALKIH